MDKLQPEGGKVNRNDIINKDLLKKYISNIGLGENNLA